MRIVVVYNLPDKNSKVSEADEDTLNSAIEIQTTLTKLGHEAVLFGISIRTIASLSKIKADLVFNLVEWTGKYYRYGIKVLDQLHRIGIPFTGSDKFGWSLTSDKLVMKSTMDKLGILTPKWQVITRPNEQIDPKLNFPLITKPISEHCGIGISQQSIAIDMRHLRANITKLLTTYKQPVLVEEYIEGRELHVTVLEKRGKPYVLPPAEVVFYKGKHWNILTYNAKWKGHSLDYQLSYIQRARLDPGLASRVRQVASKAYTSLGGADYPRLDIRIKDSKIYVLEINNNPGIGDDPYSGITVSSRAAGLNFKQLVEVVVAGALFRFSLARNRRSGVNPQ